VLNSISCVLATGCQWSALSKDLAPKSTAHDYFIMLDRSGALRRIHKALCIAAREQAGKEASSTAAIIHSQSAKAAQKRGSKIDPQGYDSGKKVTGRKRHIFVVTLGLLLNIIVLPADIQDRHAANDLLKQIRSRFPFVERIYADGGYSGSKTAAMVCSTGCWKIETVKRSDAHRFVVLPKRWIVERVFAWISRNRRLMREFERYAITAVVFVRLAMIRLMLKRLTRQETV
jgi:putative transposase